MKDTKETDKSGIILYDLAKGFFQFFFGLIYPVRCINSHYLETVSEPYILVANHNSNLDPLILIKLCPGRIRFLVKRELENSRFLAWCIKKIRCIPVSRGESDTHAFRDCLKALREKCVLGIFPEGTRHSGGRMENPKTGTALMALMQKVDILPVYIDGKPRIFRRTNVIVGEPVCVKDFPAGRITSESISGLSDRIKERYASLREELCRLLPDRTSGKTKSGNG